jgi:NAD(P)-dependent dehydrogenase (short-subunit alcohol dehydrogenase family)
VSSYVITGGTDAFIADLAPHLRLPVHRVPVEPITSWVHIVPDGSSTDWSAAIGAAVGLADEQLPEDEGASFSAVVPVWGVIASPFDEAAELAAAAARALLRVRIERWSQQGRRINVVAYGALDSRTLPGLRDPATLADRTPTHRLATITDLANAIDFLSSSAASYVTGSVLTLDGGWSAYSWFHPARDL